MHSYIQKKSVMIVLLLLASLLFPQAGIFASTNSEPMEQLQQSVDNILRILQSEELRVPGKQEERKQRIIEVVDKMFDFHEMARSSMGQHWNTITAEEQHKFVGCLRIWSRSVILAR